MGQAVRQEHVVGIEKGDERAAGSPQTGVAGRAETAVASRRAKPKAMLALRSREASSTTMHSQSSKVWRATDSRQSAMNRSSSKHGTMTLTTGDSANRWSCP
jgi:hypothetical protein